MKAASLHASVGLRNRRESKPALRCAMDFCCCFFARNGSCLFGQADAAKPLANAPLRLAIAEFAVSKETESASF